MRLKEVLMSHKFSLNNIGGNSHLVQGKKKYFLKT